MVDHGLIQHKNIKELFECQYRFYDETTALPQEEEAAAFGKAPEPEEEDCAEQVESDDESSSEMFGFAASKVKKPAKRKAHDSKPAKDGDAEAADVAPSAPAKKAKTARGAKSEKPPKAETGEKNDDANAKVIAKANALLDFWGKFDAAAFWAGSVKAKDLDNKLNKSFDIVAEMESMDISTDEKAVQKKLSETASATSPILDLFPAIVEQIKQFNANSELPQFSVVQMKLLVGLPSDCLNAILTDLGRKLTEDGGHCSKHLWYRV